MDFQSWILPAALADGLAAEGIVAPTPVQERVIPLLLEGRDAIVQSETGSGKTLAYLLPLYAQPACGEKGIRLLVLVPTRELAMQVHRQAERLSSNTGLPVCSTPVCGDVQIAAQAERLKARPQIVVGTPARVLELIRRKKLAAHLVKTVVLDEADRLLDDDNRETVLAVMRCLLRDTQRVFLSASMSREAMRRAEELAHDPAVVRTSETFRIPETVEHLRLFTGSRDKLDVLVDLLRALRPRRAILFINTPEEIERALDKLQAAGLPAASLSGSRRKQDRQRAMADFTAGKTALLVASDLAARGLDIPDVDWLFHVSLPENPLEYLHRAGRAGRCGATGRSLLLVKHREQPLAAQYERALSIRFTEKKLDGKTLIDAETAVRDKKDK